MHHQLQGGVSARQLIAAAETCLHAQDTQPRLLAGQGRARRLYESAAVHQELGSVFGFALLRYCHAAGERDKSTSARALGDKGVTCSLSALLQSSRHCSAASFTGGRWRGGWEERGRGDAGLTFEFFFRDSWARMRSSTWWMCHETRRLRTHGNRIRHLVSGKVEHEAGRARELGEVSAIYQ